MSTTAKRILATQIPKKVLVVVDFFVKFGKKGSIQDQSISKKR